MKLPILILLLLPSLTVLAAPFETSVLVDYRPGSVPYQICAGLLKLAGRISGFRKWEPPPFDFAPSPDAFAFLSLARTYPENLIVFADWLQERLGTEKDYPSFIRGSFEYEQLEPGSLQAEETKKWLEEMVRVQGPKWFSIWEGYFRGSQVRFYFSRGALTSFRVEAVDDFRWARLRHKLPKFLESQPTIVRGSFVLWHLKRSRFLLWEILANRLAEVERDELLKFVNSQDERSLFDYLSSHSSTAYRPLAEQ